MLERQRLGRGQLGRRGAAYVEERKVVSVSTRKVEVFAVKLKLGPVGGYEAFGHLWLWAGIDNAGGGDEEEGEEGAGGELHRWRLPVELWGFEELECEFIGEEKLWRHLGRPSTVGWVGAL